MGQFPLGLTGWISLLSKGPDLECALSTSFCGLCCVFPYFFSEYCFQKRGRFLKNEEWRKSAARNSDGEGKAHIINHLLQAGNFILTEELMLLNCGVGEDP